MQKSYEWNIIDLTNPIPLEEKRESIIFPNDINGVSRLKVTSCEVTTEMRDISFKFFVDEKEYDKIKIDYLKLKNRIRQLKKINKILKQQNLFLTELNELI